MTRPRTAVEAPGGSQSVWCMYVLGSRLGELYYKSLSSLVVGRTLGMTPVST